MSQAPHPSEKNTRRRFIELSLGWVFAGMAASASAAAAVRFLVPNVLYEPGDRFKLGKPGDYTDGSVNFLESEKVFLIRKGNTYRSLSAVCTHLGCTVNRSNQGYHCPCHGSSFDEQGEVKGGPAPRSLAWYEVSLSRDGRLVIDKGQRVAADKYLVI